MSMMVGSTQSALPSYGMRRVSNVRVLLNASWPSLFASPLA